MCFSVTFTKKKEQMPVVNFKGLVLETGAVEKFIIIAFKYFVSTGRGRELIWGIKKKKKDYIILAVGEEKLRISISF